MIIVRGGFTMAETLIVVALILVLTSVAGMNFRGQVLRAKDAQRKTDLYLIRKALEEYANDHGVFPPQSIVHDCGGSELSPSIPRIPCDPESKLPYGYFPSHNGGYRLCAKLWDTTDPSIIAMGCNGSDGCGVGSGYNYCLTSGVTASAVGTVDQIISTPTIIALPSSTQTTTPTTTPITTPITTPLPPGSYFACAPDYEGCNSYREPDQQGCPIWWLTGCPSGACSNPANFCAW